MYLFSRASSAGDQAGFHSISILSEYTEGGESDKIKSLANDITT